MMIPYIMPELPQEQKDALAYGVKSPMVMTNVALRNWHAWDKLKVSGVDCPGSFYETVALTPGADLGGLTHARSPDEPVAVWCKKTFTQPGLTRRDQHRAGRQKLLETSFEDFERETRSQLAPARARCGFYFTSVSAVT